MWHLHVWGHILPTALSASELPTRLGSFHQDLDVRPFILPQGWPKLPKQGESCPPVHKLFPGLVFHPLGGCGHLLTALVLHDSYNFRVDPSPNVRI